MDCQSISVCLGRDSPALVGPSVNEGDRQRFTARRDPVRVVAVRTLRVTFPPRRHSRATQTPPTGAKAVAGRAPALKKHRPVRQYALGLPSWALCQIDLER